MKLPNQIRMSQTKLPLVDKGLQAEREEVARVLNGNISFGVADTVDNINGAWVKIADTGAADTNFTLTHNLNRVPEGWLVVKQSIAGSTYVGTITWTKTQITLKFSAAHAALTLFVI